MKLKAKRKLDYFLGFINFLIQNELDRREKNMKEVLITIASFPIGMLIMIMWLMFEELIDLNFVGKLLQGNNQLRLIGLLLLSGMVSFVSTFLHYYTISPK